MGIVHTTKSTRYWHAIKNGRIQCDLCPRNCKLHNGQQGLCFIRESRNDEIVLTSYGRSSGFCIDPVEKKPLNHFFPGSSVLSFGTAGCNLACKFCQNWDISKSREDDRLALNASPLTIAKAASGLNVKSVAYTYNDPIIFHEYAIEVASECRKVGVKSIAVTAGYINSEPRIEFFENMDATNVDLKAFTDDFYFKLTGAHLEPVLETLIYIKKHTKVWLEITNLLIPGANDSSLELENMCKWIVSQLGCDVPLHFTAFHPSWKMMHTPATPPQTLYRAREIAKQCGLRYVYTGNIHDKAGGSTYCHRCGEILIGRDWYELSEWNLDNGGHCSNCGEKCAGLFDSFPGSWGSKRQPIDIELFN